MMASNTSSEMALELMLEELLAKKIEEMGLVLPVTGETVKPVKEKPVKVKHDQAKIDEMVNHYGAESEAHAIEMIETCEGRNNLNITYDKNSRDIIIRINVDTFTGFTAKNHLRVASTHGNYGYRIKDVMIDGKKHDLDYNLSLNNYALNPDVLAEKQAKKATREAKKTTTSKTAKAPNGRIIL